MTTPVRIRLLASVLKKYPELGIRNGRELNEWLRLELGSENVLDRWQPYGRTKTRAMAPGVLYHVCAGNLPVSGFFSIVCGLLLGSRNIVKVPDGRGSEFRKFVRTLPLPLRKRVVLRTRFSIRDLEAADAVIVFGRDETVAEIRGQVPWQKPFLGYGHRASLIWVARRHQAAASLVRNCADDAGIYNQKGCLSPHAIYLEKGIDAETFGARLAEAMEKWDAKNLSVTEAAAIREARAVARSNGERVWESKNSLRWTVILSRRAKFQLSCLNRVIYLKQASVAELPGALEPVAGQISTVGLAGPLNAAEEQAFARVGAQRFCRTGAMQHPPVAWHHDGRPSLSGLVKWVDVEDFGLRNADCR
jgi:hypothetical protein